MAHVSEKLWIEESIYELRPSSPLSYYNKEDKLFS